MMYTWGNAIFQRGVSSFHLNFMYYPYASLQTEILK